MDWNNPQWRIGFYRQSGINMAATVSGMIFGRGLAMVVSILFHIAAELAELNGKKL